MTLIPAQLSEIKEYEIVKRGNHSNPLKSQQMLSRHTRVHYVSCQVTRSPCGCRNLFGADAHQDVWTSRQQVWRVAGSDLEDEFCSIWDPSDAFQLAYEDVAGSMELE